MTNSTTPSPMSAARCMPVASPNSLAMTPAIVSPDEKRCVVICALEPIVSATAIVSPIARPRPSITAPTMPARTRGNTVDAQHLPPGRAHPERRVLVVLRDGRERLTA